MPDITLTITIDEADARSAVQAFGGYGSATVYRAVGDAISAALPPPQQLPKKGEVWADVAGQEQVIGPTWEGSTLCRSADGDRAWSFATSWIVANWKRVR